MKSKNARDRVIVILGQTATGKSDLAVKLAKRFNGEVISADSRQVYKGLDLGSGKITKKEMKGVRHHLLDVVSPKRVFTVQEYQKLANRAIEDILRRGRLPIICGGTGQYIDSVIYGIQFPEVPPNLALRKKLEKLSTSELFARIGRLDPERAKTIDKNNRRRLIRAIEIVKALGKVPVRQLADKQESPYEIFKIGLQLPKEELEKRIKKRLEKRLKLGMIKEVKNLHKNGLSWKRLDSFGLEYRYISRYLHPVRSREDGSIRHIQHASASNGIRYDQMKAEILKESLHYAKRQMTWFKRDKEIFWENNQKKIEKLAESFLKKKTRIDIRA